MSGITNPAEEYFKDGLWAWDPAAGVWLKLIIDPLTNRLVIDHPGDLEVVQPVPADLCVANYGWIGAAWHKLPMLWGFSERWAEKQIFTASGTGHATGSTDAIVAGWVYVLQVVSGTHDSETNEWVQVWIQSDSVTPSVFEDQDLPSGETFRWKGEFVLSPGDTVVGWCSAPGHNKSLTVHFWGYKMKVAE